MFRSVVVLKCVCELRKREKKTSYLAFLARLLTVYGGRDCVEGGSVRREGVWCKMRHYGVEEKFVKVCEGLYRGVETSVVMNGVKSFVLRWVLGKDALYLHFCLIFI